MHCGPSNVPGALGELPRALSKERVRCRMKWVTQCILRAWGSGP
jgi:hypothetical protein